MRWSTPDWGGLKAWFRSRFPVPGELLVAVGSEPVPNHVKHWWWCLGGTPAYLFFVQLTTGVLLAFYYVPSATGAYESVLRINTEIPYGWYLRSIHRWSSHFMIVAVILHMMRVFFTGAYRKPRELNWMIGVCILAFTLVFGFTGYSLVYEQLSYWGATVAGNLTEGVPFVGPALADFIRGGPEIGQGTLTRFFAFHIGVLPTLMFLGLSAHFTLIRLHGVTPFAFEKEEEGKTFPFFPDHVLKEIGIGVTLMFLMTILAVVFPVGLEEKANPLVTPEHIRPEWYFYFTFRWLKLTSLTFAILSTGMAFFALLTWPFIDAVFRRKKPGAEWSVYIGVAVAFFIIVLTVWEALASHG